MSMHLDPAHLLSDMMPSKHFSLFIILLFISKLYASLI